MRRWIPVAIIVFLLAGFVVIAQAIISIKLLELRVKISRERILNYELSSRVLKERFISLLDSEKKSFDKEVKQSVMEAAIMNDKDPEALQLSSGEYAGLFVINVVRKISFKPFMHLMADQQQLLLMKYAFFMERNRRYDKASQKYKVLEEMMSSGHSDARGFVMLHHGYCLAVAGKPKESLELLYQVKNDAAGTHYSQTASVLIHILETAQKQKNKVESLTLTNVEKARKYYYISQHSQAIRLFSLEDNLNAIDSYRISRSREELGKVTSAIQGYLDIVNKNSNPRAVKLANRRLLLIGSFYGGGKKVKEFAVKKAKAMGDVLAVKEIKVAEKTKRKDIILEEIKENSKKSSSNDGEKSDPLFKELGKEIESSIVLEERITAIDKKEEEPQKSEELEKEEVKESKKEVIFIKKPKKKIYPKTVINSTFMKITLQDGRQFNGKELLFHDTTVTIVSKRLQFEVPLDIVKAVFLSNRQKSLKMSSLFLVLNNGDKIKITTIKSIVDDEIQVVMIDGSEKSYDVEDIKKVVIH